MKNMLAALLICLFLCSCGNREFEQRGSRIYLKGEKRPYTGECVFYHENGKLKSRFNVLDGHCDGVMQDWYDNGQLFRLLCFTNGMYDGPQVTWHRNGQISSSFLHDGGKLEGAYICWYESGRKESVAYYGNGIRTKESRWDESGKLISDGEFKDQKRFNGTSLVDGKVVEYKMGKRVVPAGKESENGTK